MHPVNRILGRVGLHLSATPRVPAQLFYRYRQQLAELRATPGEFDIREEMYFEAGEHPASYIDAECAFTSRLLHEIEPQRILDIGSHRTYILGLLAHFPVTTIDVRSRRPAFDQETTITSDAKHLQVDDESFNAVVSLCAVEHFGLGRYGDDLDMSADSQAFAEMIRVLKPSGHLIFSTTITRGRPTLAFNGHRIYSYEMIHRLCRGLVLREETFYSRRAAEVGPITAVTDTPGEWDVYIACWQKP